MTINNIEIKNNITFDHNISKERKKTTLQTQTSNDPEITTNDNRWHWSMPEYLSPVNCYSQDPIGDENCVFSSLLTCTFHSNTNFD